MTETIALESAMVVMTKDYNIVPKEQFRHNWNELNTAVVEQGNATFDGCQTGFHLLERCISGSHKLSSQGVFETGSKCETVSRAGTLSFLQCHSPLTEECEGHAQIQQIYLSRSLFQTVIDSVAPGDPDNLEILGFKCISDLALANLCEKLLDEARLNGPGGQLYADLLGQELALHILRRQLSRDYKIPPGRPLEDQEVSIVLDYLEENLEFVSGISSLADLISMDVFSFSRAFKSKTGESPHQFLISRRIERVKDILANSNTSLCEASYAAGFASQSHMTATFRKRMGTSPGVWRSLVRQ